MANNNIYKNAAFAGALAGMLDGRPITSATAGDYTAIRAAAAAFAVDMDAAIANDVLVSDGAGLQLDPSTATIAANEQARGSLLANLCRGAWSGRVPPSTAVAGTQAVMVAAIATLFTAALADFTTP